MDVAQPHPHPLLAADLTDAWWDAAARLPTDLEDDAALLAYRAVVDRSAPTAEEAARELSLVVRADAVAAVPVLRLSPPVVAEGEVPRAVRLVFVHGGGLVAGQPLHGVAAAARHAADLRAEVVTVGYPRAPEASLDQAVGALGDVVDALAAEDPAVPLLVVGESAGGAVVASWALDGAVPAGVVGLMLLCPMLGDTPTAAMATAAGDPFWSPVSNAAAWAAALRDTGRRTPLERVLSEDDAEVEAAARLPPVWVDVGSADLFRDHAVSFAARLWTLGVRTELHVVSGGFHGFDGALPQAPASRQLHMMRAAWLRRALDRLL